MHLISIFVFAIKILQSLHFLNLKFQVPSLGCTARFVFDLVENPENRFSQDVAQLKWPPRSGELKGWITLMFGKMLTGYPRLSVPKPRIWFLFDLMLYVQGKQLRSCWDCQFLNHTVPGQASWRQFTSIKFLFFCQYWHLALLESAEEGNYFSTRECAVHEDWSLDSCLRSRHATDRANAPCSQNLRSLCYPEREV